MDEAEHVVLATADHRIARVRGVGGHLGRPADRHRRIEERHLGARHHHLADRPLPRGEDVVDEPPLVGGQRFVGRDQAPQLGVADRLATRVWVAAEQPDDAVGRLRQQPDHRPEGAGQSVERRREQCRCRLGALQGQPLGRQLAEDERDERDDQGHADDPDRTGQARAPAVRDEGLLGRLGQRDGAEGAGQQRGRGHADLDGGEEPVRVAGQPGYRRAPAAGLGQRADLALAQRRRARSRPRRKRPR